MRRRNSPGRRRNNEDWRANNKPPVELVVANLEKNLQEVSELVSNNILGMKNGVDIIIDGDSLFDRLIALQIDQDILCCIYR